MQTSHLQRDNACCTASVGVTCVSVETRTPPAHAPPEVDVKPALQRFLDQTARVQLLKLRIFGGNQEMVVNRRSTIAGLPSVFCTYCGYQGPQWVPV